MEFKLSSSTSKKVQKKYGILLSNKKERNWMTLKGILMSEKS